MKDNSAKDFTRFPELFDCYMDRIKRSHHAAEQYMVPGNDLLTRGIVQFHGLVPDPDKREMLVREIGSKKPGDAKRKDTMVIDVGWLSRQLMPEIRARILQFFRTRQEEVWDQMTANTYLQHLEQSPYKPDIQRVLHCDTFFPALKFWYFPHQVDDGAFVYVDHSPQLTVQRLTWHRDQVERIRHGQAESWRGQSHLQGSLRISDGELSAMGLEARPVTVPADTLVIANVFGFHRRGDTVQERRRFSINGSIRFKNPFKHV